MVELVDTADLKSAAFLHKGRTGSIPVPGTITKRFADGLRDFPRRACTGRLMLQLQFGFPLPDNRFDGRCTTLSIATFRHGVSCQGASLGRDCAVRVAQCGLVSPTLGMRDAPGQCLGDGPKGPPIRHCSFHAGCCPAPG